MAPPRPCDRVSQFRMHRAKGTAPQPLSTTAAPLCVATDWRLWMAKLRTFKTSIVKQLDSLANHFGYQVTRKIPIIYLHQYASYEEYKETQVRLNHAKLHNVWAD